MLHQLIYSPFKPLLFIVGYWYGLTVKSGLYLICVRCFVCSVLFLRAYMCLICMIPPLFTFLCIVGICPLCLGVFEYRLIAPVFRLVFDLVF